MIPIIPRHGNRDQLLASFEQERLIFLQQFDPRSCHYNMATALLLRGSLDVTVLQWALAHVVNRHDALRTRFVTVDGTPIQELIHWNPTWLTREDVSTAPLADREKTIDTFIRTKVQQPFELQDGPLLRLHLLHLPDDEHVFLLVTHHIVNDAWSMDIFARELSASYNARLASRSVTLSPLPLQYGDYCMWQRQTVSGDQLEQHLAYWRSHLANAPVLDLTLSGPRPPLQTHVGADHRFDLTPDLAHKVRALCQQERATLFMTVLASFALLLSRYSDHTDIVIGTPISLRQSVQLEGLIGFFLNTAALRLKLDSNLTFRSLVQRARDVSLEAYVHGDAPFAELVSELEPRRELSRSPLFQVYLVVDHSPGDGWALDGLTVTPLPVVSGTAKFDLTLFVRERANALQAHFEYNSDLFSSAYIERLAQHFVTLLDQVTTNPDRALSAVTLLSPAEHRQLTIDWNATDRAVPLDCVHTLFERQARSTPGAPALAAKGQRVTYHALNRQANRLARRIAALTPSPARIAILIPRSPEQIAAVIATLKVGAAYVPLDSEHPDVRLRAIVEDAEPTVVLTTAGLQHRLNGIHTPTIVIDDGVEDLGAGCDDNPTRRVAPQDLFYIIYTSGSTGTPKGIALPHRAISNLIHWHRTTLGISAVTLQYASLAFDASCHEIFSALCWGGMLVLIDHEDRTDVPALVDVIRQERIQKLTMPGVVIDRICDHCIERGIDLPDLRHAIATGEQLHVTAHMRRFFERGSCLLHNHYGPSETHVVTAFTCEGAPAAWPSRPPIGRPIANTQAYVVDVSGHLAPIGIAGELLIGGHNVADGYWRQPNLTEKSFIHDRFRSTSTCRLYRTGDMARWQPDGNLEFLGRRDRQVKIRGSRVEVSEVELVLATHPDIATAAVVVTSTNERDKRLTAYVALRKGAEVDPTSLRAFLQERLPEFMVPSIIAATTALPLTANGKIDRGALEAAAQHQEGSRAPWAAPSTPTEERLATIWAEVLGLARVGQDDNFFDLGGHSLLAMRIVARASATLKCSIPLKALFESPTPRQFADRVDALKAQERPPDTPVVARTRSVHDRPVSCNQQKRLLTEECLHRRRREVPPFNLALHLRIEGPADPSLFEGALERLIQRHEILRASFTASPHFTSTARARDLAAFAVSGTISREMHTHSIQSHVPLAVAHETLADDTQNDSLPQLQRLASRMASLPFQYDRPPLIRMTTVQLAPDQYALLMVLPHLVSDAASIRIVKRDFTTLCRTGGDWHQARLRPLTHQFSDFAMWQHEYVDGEAAKDALTYWLRQWRLFGAERLRYADWSTPESQGAVHARGDHYLTLGTVATAELRRFARNTNATVYMACLTSFYITLYHYTGRPRLAVWANFENRERPEFIDVLGWFVNSHILGIGLEGEPTIDSLLSNVRTLLLDAQMHQALPTSVVWRHLGSLPLLRDELPVFVDFRTADAGLVPSPAPRMSLRVEDLHLDPRGMTLPGLYVTVCDQAQQLEFRIAYNTPASLASVVPSFLKDWIALTSILGEVAGLPLSMVTPQLVALRHYSGPTRVP